MNKITKKSFYSFLALYLISSFFFLALTAYWFFDAQVAMEKNANYYKMNHIADVVSSNIVHSAMNGLAYKLEMFDKAAISLFDKEKQYLDGLVVQQLDFSEMFYMKDGIFTLISARTAGHSGIEYVVVQSSECIKNIDMLKNTIAYTVIITAILIILIAISLSYIFLKPIRDKMEEIEEFVKDTTHELNTPITALMMSTSRIKNKKVYDEKIVQNISISTKQLYEIYSSLSFLSFDHKSEEAVWLSFNQVVEESVAYFSELLEKKNIAIDAKLKECNISIAPTKAKMLINNLLSNAIKYSHPNTKITLTTTANSFTIIDEGIGIKKEKLHTIFQRFVRASSYAGGFGVGLNIVQSILKEYDFQINIDSAQNKGTTIKILFKE
jgi:two-component system OmpR family sensor kinase